MSIVPTLAGVQRFWRERSYYCSVRDWGVAFYSRLIQKLPRSFRFTLPLPFRGRLCRMRLTNHPHPFHVRLGTTDSLVLANMFIYGEYDYVTSLDLRDVKLIVDLGANVGFSVRFWLHCYPAAHVIAVEPIADNARMFERNLAGLPESKNVDFQEVCAGASRRQVVMQTTDGAWAYSVSETPAKAARGLESTVLTIPELLHNGYSAASIDILKCDIEGSEVELFGNCQDWIGRVRALVVGLHGDYSVDDFLRDINRGPARFKIVKVGSSNIVTAVRC